MLILISHKWKHIIEYIIFYVNKNYIIAFEWVLYCFCFASPVKWSNADIRFSFNVDDM